MFWVFLATALFFWVSAAVNQIPGREPGASRYQLIGAVLVVLIAAELLRGMRPSPRWLALIGVLAIAAIVSNFGALRAGEHFLRDRSDENSAKLAALDIARNAISPDVELHDARGSPFTALASAQSYFDAVDRWGTPISDPNAALNRTEAVRKSADRFLSGLLSQNPSQSP